MELVELVELVEAMLLRREPEPNRRAICALVAFHQQPSVPHKLTQLTQLAHTAEMSLQLLRAGFKPLPSFSPCPQNTFQTTAHDQSHLRLLAAAPAPPPSPARPQPVQASHSACEPANNGP